MDVHVSDLLDHAQLEQALLKGADPQRSLEWISDSVREELEVAVAANPNLLRDLPDAVDWQDRTTSWLLPESYQTMDIVQHVRGLCRNDADRAVVDYELAEFEARSLLPMLRAVKYLVDVMREQEVVYGVGRGSSTSSLVLYLLKAHRIDPIKWNLDPGEFFK